MSEGLGALWPVAADGLAFALGLLRRQRDAAAAPRSATTAAAIDVDVDLLLRLRHLAERMAASRRPPRSALPGSIAHRRRGRGLEIHDIRAWSDGDDIRHLDRNVMARTGVPHVRTFREERERAALLVADFRPSMLFGTRRTLRSVAAAEALALLGWQAAHEGGRVGLVTLAAHAPGLIRYGRGARAMIAVNGALAQAHRAALDNRAAADPPLDAALEEADALAGKSGTIIVATGLDAPGARFDAVVARIARRRDLAFVLIVDAFEAAPPPGSYAYATAGDAGWLRIGRTPPKPDDRIAQLQKLGARAVALASNLSAEATAAQLERLHD